MVRLASGKAIGLAHPVALEFIPMKMNDKKI